MNFHCLESDYRIIQKPQYFGSQIFSEADIGQSGSGFKFGDTNYYQQVSDKPEFFAMKTKESESSQVLFPVEKKDDYRYASNYVNRPINSFDNFQAYNFKKESIRKDRKFFPVVRIHIFSCGLTMNIDLKRKSEIDFSFYRKLITTMITRAL